LCLVVHPIAASSEAPGEQPAGPRAPNLIVISIDTLRADHTSLSGYHRDTTPSLSRLAREGMSFEVAYAPTSATAPTHATLFTGRYPATHGLLHNGLALAPEARTLAESLREAGHQTVAIVSSFVLDRRFGMDQGFETYQDDFEVESSTVRTEEWEQHAVPAGFDRRAGATTKRALRWLSLERDASRPFFLFLHYFDPHAPYAPPEEFGRPFAVGDGDATRGRERRLDPTAREKIARYDAEIAYTDREIGRLLNELERRGLMDDTLIVVTADHGEGLMDHGLWTHSVDIHEESVRVPLVLHWPGHVPAKGSAKEPVELVDVMPTLLDLMGISNDAGLAEGRSLAPAIRGDAPLDPDRPVFLYRRHFGNGTVDGVPVHGHQLGVRQGSWKLIHHSRGDAHELYDLEEDPGELRNLYPTRPKERQALEETLDDWRKGRSTSRPAGEISPDVKQALEALGYTE
jgi:arylsulfatase A-like enzyme